jgi:hypothetical protein
MVVLFPTMCMVLFSCEPRSISNSKMKKKPQFQILFLSKYCQHLDHLQTFPTSNPKNVVFQVDRLTVVNSTSLQDLCIAPPYSYSVILSDSPSVHLWSYYLLMSLSIPSWTSRSTLHWMSQTTLCRSIIFKQLISSLFNLFNDISTVMRSSSSSIISMVPMTQSDASAVAHILRIIHAEQPSTDASATFTPFCASFSKAGVLNTTDLHLHETKCIWLHFICYHPVGKDHDLKIVWVWIIHSLHLQSQLWHPTIVMAIYTKNLLTLSQSYRMPSIMDNSGTFCHSSGILLTN